MKILKCLLMSAGILLLVAVAGCSWQSSEITTLKPLASSAPPSRTETLNTTELKPDTTQTQTQTEPITPGTTEPSPAPDTTPPVISGEDFEITQGEGVSYRKQVTVTDDTDASPILDVDNSAVDLDTPGTYPVIYTATDSAGNSSTLTLMLTVKPRFVEGANEGYVLHLADEVLSEITDESDSKLQVAYSIWRWTRSHIAYVDTSDKTSWIVGAYDGFTSRKGDCFTYFAVSKALLTAAGIDHVNVERDRPSESSARHYWLLVNVGNGWYHFDSTTYYAKAKPTLFMLTDAELKAWDQKYYKTEHNYISDGLPEVSTESIQYMVDYGSAKLKEQ